MLSDIDRHFLSDNLLESDDWGEHPVWHDCELSHSVMHWLRHRQDGGAGKMRLVRLVRLRLVTYVTLTKSNT